MSTTAAPFSGSSLADDRRDLARSRVLRAARSVLAERGLSATVDDVAEAAGLSRRTVFRHFETRERLFAAALEDGLRSYAQQLGAVYSASPGDDWLADLLLAAHRLNANNGRIYWELAALETEVEGELASVAAERRTSRKRFATQVTTKAWTARGGTGRPPTWLIDAFAVHFSAFTTQSVGGDFRRTPEDVAAMSARVLDAALNAALAPG